MKLLLPLLLGSLCVLITQESPAGDRLPTDVLKYIERRNACDHWRGEDGYDRQRQIEIKAAQCKFCTGSDADLARLKAKYKANPVAIDRLNKYESKIEPTSKKERNTICKGISNHRSNHKY